MEQEQSAYPVPRIVGVVTAAFNPRSEAEIVTAIMQAAQIPLTRMILVHDVKGTSGRYVEIAKSITATELEASKIEVLVLTVNADETALRWRFGVDLAFSDPSVECAFVIPSDFKDQDKKEAILLREGLREMARHAHRNWLVVGDYETTSGTFKEIFDRDLVGLTAIDAVYPGYADGVLQHKLRKLRSEFMCLGREVLECARAQRTLWDMDPTVSLVLVVLRTQNLTLKVVDLGCFNDDARTRSPLGQLLQITRYVAQLIINRIRLDLSRQTDDSQEVILHDDLRVRIEAGFRACLKGIDANRRHLGPPHSGFKRTFNNNDKTKLTFNIGWQDFFGFSLLADPTDADLVEECPGTVTIHNVAGSNILYDRLFDLVFGPWGDSMEGEFVFARLPHSSYHLTIKDGVNVDNLHLLKPSAASAIRALFEGLPGSLAAPNAIVQPLGSISVGAPIRFHFTKLSIWNRSALVARIEPADAESQSLVSVIDRRREDLDQEWEDVYGLPIAKNSRWAPHISLGYFPNREIAPITETRLAQWSDEFAAHIGDAICEFNSFSIYAFTNMATFVKSNDSK